MRAADRTGSDLKKKTVEDRGKKDTRSTESSA